MHEPYILFSVLLGSIALFIWGYWRYDLIAMIALITLVLLGIVPFSGTFAGFSNPAVITVACVMVITYSITQSGIVDYAVKRLTPATNHIVVHIAILCFIAAILSAFMNNVGALALMMPVAIQVAIKNNRSPSLILMPLAFSSVLGGLTTAIGTPPNLLISAYRSQVAGNPFAMFDFSPVGLLVAAAGTIFIAFFGWRLIPQERKAPKQAEDMFQIQDYISEVIITEDSPIAGKTLRDLEQMIEGAFIILGLIRAKRKRLVITPDATFREKDVLIIQASPDDLEKLLKVGKLNLVGGKPISSETLRSENIGFIEAVVPQGSRLEGRSAQSIRLRSRYRTNLLAISRQGKPFKKRLNHVNLRAGDVVLLQGEMEVLPETIANLGFLPLIERDIQVGKRRSALLPIAIFGLAITLAAMQILPVQIAFATAVLLIVLLNIIPIRKLYESIDWSVIVLLAAMIPIGNALDSTGGTQVIANLIMRLTGELSPIFIIGLLLMITMTLSDFMNNAATAVVMAPIAVSVANGMHANLDPFLMAVAVGASCSFLTPISHQNNTLVLGPGGYKFFDYMRMGFPLELIVLALGLPMIIWVWPI